MNTMTTGSPLNIDVTWKPVGRGRRFARLARGLARRLRIPWVRSTLWEMNNPQVRNGATSYGVMWTSTNALADYSFACPKCAAQRGKYRDKRGRFKRVEETGEVQ